MSIVVDVLFRSLFAVFCIVLGANNWAYLLLGILSWCAAILLKPPAYKIAQKLKFKSPFLIAAKIGILSAALELLTTLTCFILFRHYLNMSKVVAFGLGIAAIESLFTVAQIIRLFKKIPRSNVNWTTFIGTVERLGAALTHVGSRCLIFISLTSPLYFLPALLMFSILDGLAVYGAIKKWNYADKKTFVKFYSAIYFIGLITIYLIN